MTSHFDLATLDGFLAGNLPVEKTREVAGHLLRGCKRCQELAQRYWYDAGGEGAKLQPMVSAETSRSDQTSRSDLDWASLAKRLTDRETELEQERAAAQQTIGQLLSKPLGARLMVIRNSPACGTLAVVEGLLQRAWDLRFHDAHALIETAQTALACAESLNPSRYGTAVHDLRSRCWSHLGTGFGILHDYRESESCHQRAKEELDRGTGDPLELASWLKHQIGLRVRQKNIEGAAATSERLLSIVERVGNKHSIGEAKNFLGGVRANQERLPEAIELLEESCELLDPQIDVRFFANSLHNLVALLDEVGRQEEALVKLAELRTLYEQLGDRLPLLRLMVTEGEIAAGMGNHLLAERCFLMARNGFVSAKLPVEAATATLELSLLYLENGRYLETRRIAEQMIPILQIRGLEREAMAALLIFRESAMRETVTAKMVTETLKLVRSVHQRSAAKGRND